MTTIRGSSRWRLPERIALPALGAALTALFIAAGAPSPLLVYYQRDWRFAPALLTLAFGTYALGLLGALLTVGSLSDHVGRRPVVVGALVLELAALVLFLRAGDVQQLVWARLVQGVATGGATSALTAWMIELSPPRLAKMTSVVSSIAPAGGLGLGALLAGLCTVAAPNPPMVVWIALLIVVALGLGSAAVAPETRVRVAGAARSLIPRVRVGDAARRPFARAVPTLVSAWLLAALFIGLMPTILVKLFGIDSLFTGGVVVFVEPAAACVSAVLLAGVPGMRVLRLASALIVVGAALVLAGILATALPLLVLGGAVAGAGFGAANAGTFRVLLPLATPDDRGALVSAIYFAAYLAFGVPAIVAGLLVPVVGLEWVVAAFAALIVVTAGAGVVFSARPGASRNAALTG